MSITSKTTWPPEADLRIDSYVAGRDNGEPEKHADGCILQRTEQSSGS